MERYKNSLVFYLLAWLFLVLAPTVYAILSDDGLILLTRSIDDTLRSWGIAVKP